MKLIMVFSLLTSTAVAAEQDEGAKRSYKERLVYVMNCYDKNNNWIYQGKTYDAKSAYKTVFQTAWLTGTEECNGDVYYE